MSFLKLGITLEVVQNALQSGKTGTEKVCIPLKFPLQFIVSCGKIHSVTFEISYAKTCKNISVPTVERLSVYNICLKNNGSKIPLAKFGALIFVDSA